jgi:hypothetical protein
MYDNAGRDSGSQAVVGLEDCGNPDWTFFELGWIGLPILFKTWIGLPIFLAQILFSNPIQFAITLCFLVSADSMSKIELMMSTMQGTF